MKPDIAAFLTARLDEEAARESAATKGPWRWTDEDDHELVNADNEYVVCIDHIAAPYAESNCETYLCASVADREFIAATRNAALATIAAHRAIVEEYARAVLYDSGEMGPFDEYDGYDRCVDNLEGLRVACLNIAAIHATHPDYQQEWRVG